MMSASKLAHCWTLDALLEGFVPVAPSSRVAITDLRLDSRDLGQGELFLAVAGTRTHGLSFFQPDSGAAAVVFEPDSQWQAAQAEWLSRRWGLPVIAMPDLRRRAGEIASRFFGEPSQGLRVTGITGTNGKTSCAWYLTQALDQDRPAGLIGTLGAGPLGALDPTGHTTPDPVNLHRQLAVMQEQGLREVAMEVSSHALDQGRVSGVRFAAALFTNLSRDHLDYHGDMQGYGAAKARLFHGSGLGLAAINSDDAFGRRLLQGLPAGVPSLAWGFAPYRGAADRVVRGMDLQLNPEGMVFRVTEAGHQSVLRSTLYGRFNAHNLLGTLAVLLGLGMPLEEAAERLSAVTGAPGRMQRVPGRDGVPRVVVDYAHTPDALEQALSALRAHGAASIRVVFGCGGGRDRGKRALMGQVAGQRADHVLLTDDNPRNENGGHIIQDILLGVERPHGVAVERNRGLAIRQAIAQAGPDEVVLIAGKGHETWQEVAGERRPFNDLDVAHRALAERDGGR